MEKHDIKALADTCYPDVTTTVTINREQMVSLFRKWKADDNEFTWHDFVHTVSPTSFDGAVVVFWCGMYLCIEADGYCHS